MNAELNPRQMRFVDEYLVDLNATQAAIRAGYSKASAASIGHENLAKPEVQKAVQAAMDERSTRTKIDQDYVMARLKKIVERATGEDFDPASALRGLELLGKHLRLFTDES